MKIAILRIAPVVSEAMMIMMLGFIGLFNGLGQPMDGSNSSCA